MMNEQQELVYGAMSGLVEVFEDVTEPRGGQGRRHLLTDTLAISVNGCLCGCDNAEALEDWGVKEQEWSSDFLELRYGIPSQDTYLRVLAAIDEREFRDAFMTWVMKTFLRAVREGHIALDGKTGDKQAEKKAVHMVNAFACEHGLVLAQEPTADKSNEIPALYALLKLIYVKGSLISVDSIGCQTDIARRITERGGDYLFGLKGNQKTLRTQTEQLFVAVLDDETRPHDYDELPDADTSTDVEAVGGELRTWPAEDFPTDGFYYARLRRRPIA